MTQTQYEDTADGIVQRLGIIGDVHGQDALLAAALAHLATIADLDRLVCTDTWCAASPA